MRVAFLDQIVCCQVRSLLVPKSCHPFLPSQVTPFAKSFHSLLPSQFFPCCQVMSLIVARNRYRFYRATIYLADMSSFCSFSKFN